MGGRGCGWVDWVGGLIGWWVGVLGCAWVCVGVRVRGCACAWVWVCGLGGGRVWARVMHVCFYLRRTRAGHCVEAVPVLVRVILLGVFIYVSMSYAYT